MTEKQSDQSKKLTSESYQKAMQSTDNILFANNKSTADPAASTQSINNNQANNQMSLKRQEAKFYVQQLLTDFIALGVLEYESGFENAINKTFKPKSEYSWGKFFAIPPESAQAMHPPGKLTIWPPTFQDSSDSFSNIDKSFTLDTSK